MIITEDEKRPGDFKAQVKEGETIRVRPQLDWQDKKAGLTMEYLLDGDIILSRRIERKWYWYFLPKTLNIEIRKFYDDGMKRASYIRNAKVQSLEMAKAAKSLYRDE